MKFVIEPMTLSTKGYVLRAASEWPAELSRADALELSITKWETIWAWMTAHPGEFLNDGGTQSCALCRKYCLEYSCEGCPVQERTGRSFCEGSPYYAFDYTKAIRAKRELDFLKSLRRTS